MACTSKQMLHHGFPEGADLPLSHIWPSVMDPPGDVLGVSFVEERGTPADTSVRSVRLYWSIQMTDAKGLAYPNVVGRALQAGVAA